MKRAGVILILLFVAKQGITQSKTDAQSVFKMLLFIDKPNVSFRGVPAGVIKNDSLYNAFASTMSLKLDEISILKNGFYYELNCPVYKFYKLMVYDKAKGEIVNSVTYNKKLTSSEGQFFGISLIEDGYVIAINQTNGLSYRLKGFNTNDFLTFLSDFKEQLGKSEGKKLSTKRFLANYIVKDLDFNCLYEGLSASWIDRKKYPCLERGADFIRPTF